MTTRAPGTVHHQAEAVRQNLTVGLHTVTEINQSIRYADTKAAALAAVQALALTVLAARRDVAAAGLLSVLLYTVCLAGILLSAGLLAAGQAPRLTSGKPSEAPNRLAFPSLATMVRCRLGTPPSLESQQRDVWRQAADLATIAVVKYRWLHRAMVGTLSTLVGVLLWLGVTIWLR